MEFITIAGRLGALDHSQFRPFARTLFAMIKANVDTGLYTPADSCKNLRIQLDPRQKMYEVEINHAALMLEEAFPSITNGAWIIHMKNAFGDRIVAPTVCAGTMVLDPITRACVSTDPLPPLPIPDPIPDPVPGHTPAGFDTKTLMYLGAGALVIMLVMGR